jgi:hypothetical protein
MLILLVLAAAAAGPGLEGKALGIRLARTKGIVTLAPTLAQKDVAELAKEDPSMSSDQRQRLIEIGKEETQAGIDRIVQAFGAGYAKHLPCLTFAFWSAKTKALKQLGFGQLSRWF